MTKLNPTARQALQQAEILCQKKGLRLTALRRRVLQLIWAAKKPAKAYDILENIGDIAAAKPPTVYRALDFLLHNGFIHKLNSQNAYVGCAHPQHSRHECFLIFCTKCGDTGECCDSKTTAAIKRLAAANGFQSAHITLEIEGRCRQCQ